MKLSIIIINYNTKEFTKNCLKSVFEKMKDIDCEVILTDNASRDGSVEMVKCNFPQVKLIENDENLGFSKANNQAIRISKGKYVLLLNSDTLILNNDFDEVIKFMDKNKDIGILGCRINNPDGTVQLSCYKFPSIWEMVTHSLLLKRLFPDNKWLGDFRNWGHDEVKEVGFVIGAFFLIRRKTLEDIGLLDERFFLNAEEAEYALRAKKAGWKTIFYPHFKIIHYGGKSKDLLDDKGSLFQLKGTEYLIEKHYGLFYLVFFKFLFIILYLFRFATFGVCLLFLKGDLKREVKSKFNHSRKLLLFQLGLIK